MKKQYIISFIDINTGLLSFNKKYESNSKKEACIKFKQDYPYCQIITVSKIEVSK